MSRTEQGVPAGGETPLAPPVLTRPVYVADRVPARQRRTEDLLDIVIAAACIAAVLLLGVYAHSTTQGVTEDVRNALAGVIRQILLLPLTLLESLFILLAPVAVVVELAMRRRLATIVGAIAAGVCMAAAAWAIAQALPHAPDAITSSLSVSTDAGPVVALSASIMTLSAFFTAAGESANTRSVRYCWWGVWILVVLGVLRGSMTLPAGLISVLLGRLVGCAARYAQGVEDRRARPLDLVAALLDIGIAPSRLIRTDLDTARDPLTTWRVVQVPDEDAHGEPADEQSASGGEADEARAGDADADQTGEGGAPGGEGGAPDGEGGAPDGGEPGSPGRGRPKPAGARESGASAGESRYHLRIEDVDLKLTAFTVAARPPKAAERRYEVWDRNGLRLELTVMDPDRRITGTLVDVWNNLRLRGISRWVSPSIKARAERATLTALSAARAGVRTPEPLGLAEAGDSLVLVQGGLPEVARLRDVPPERLTDHVLDDVWRQLLAAHHHAIVHRNLDFDSVVLDQAGRVWVLDWDQGEVAASELNRRIDVAQLLVLEAACAGADRALASARRVAGAAALRAAAPVMQAAVLPPQVSRAARHADIVNTLREATMEGLPTSERTPIRLQRFSARTIVVAGIGVIALFVVLGSMNFDEVVLAVRHANPWWILATFLIGTLTWFGSAIPLVAFAPERIRLPDAMLAQVAGSIVTVVAPSGIGPAALNLRFLNRHHVSTPQGLATVTLVQLSQFVTSALLLVTFLPFAGSTFSLSLPSDAVMVVAGVLAVGVAIVLGVPRLRQAVWSRLEPSWRQVYPRLLWIVGHPWRLLAGIGGDLLMNASYIGAFGTALLCFGRAVDPMSLTITYLASITVGGVVPAPGGIGPMEAALTAGLRVAGVPAAVAISTAVVFRLATFYLRIPFGWVALRVMQRRGLV